MRNPFRTALFVGIGADAITLVDERQDRGAPKVMQTDWDGLNAGTGAEWAARFGQLLGDAKVSRERVQIVLSDALVRYFTVTPPANLADVRDCEAAAAMRFTSLFDEAPTQWHIQADWHLTQPFLACAIPHSLKTGIEDAARAAHVTLMGVVPHCVAAWTHWRGRLAPDSWFVLAHGARFTLGIASRYRMNSVRQLPIIATGDDALARLSTLLNREAVSLGQDVPDQVSILAPQAGQWISENDGGARFRRLDMASFDAVPEALREGAALARIGRRA